MTEIDNLLKIRELTLRMLERFKCELCDHTAADHVTLAPHFCTMCDCRGYVEYTGILQEIANSDRLRVGESGGQGGHPQGQADGEA